MSATSSHTRPPAIPHPLLTLAEAHALVVGQCTQTFLSPKLAKAGRPLPWLLGLGERVLIAEPWSHHHRIHRKKRGFSLMCQRWEVLLESVATHLRTADVDLQIWQDTPNIDIALVEKVAKQVGHPIEIYGLASIREAINQIKSHPPEDTLDHPNAILAALCCLNHWLCLTESHSG